MAPRWISAWTVLVLPCLCGCERFDREQVTASGVPEVHATAEDVDRAARWELEPTPYFVAGEREGDPAHALSMVTYAKTLGDSSVIVGNHRVELRIFNARGELSSTLGREGEGPGEYLNLWNLFPLRGDTVVVYDVGLNRLTEIDRSGEIVRTSTFSARLDPQGGMGVLPDRSVIGFRDVYPPTLGAGIHVEENALVRFLPTGELADTIDIIPGWRIQVVDNPTRGLSWNSAPFSPSARFAVGQTRLFAGWGGQYRVKVFNSQGRTLYHILVDIPARNVTGALRVRWCEDRRFNCERREIEPEFPDSIPYFDKLVASRDDWLWVRLYELWADDGTREWHVFDTVGQLAARISTPSAFRISEVRTEHVLGVWTDTLDVQSVRGYRVARD